jgi:glycerate 2-kinase
MSTRFDDQHEKATRALLMSLYEAAVVTAHPRTCVPPHLPAVPEGGRIVIIGAGKASAAMAQATERHYIAQGTRAKVAGFVTTRHGFALPTQMIEIIEAGHPVPDANSISGAARAIEAAKAAGPQDLVLVLLSGGASALWSAPVPGVSAEAKRLLTKQLLKSGAPISEMNCVRKHLSQIKGGKLAAAVFPARLSTLAISDVPGDHPDEIGSGPTVGDRSTLADARAVLAKWKITPDAAITTALADPANETVKPGDAKLAASEYRIVAAPKASIEAAAVLARAAGYRVLMLGDSLEGEARTVAAAHATLALEFRKTGEKVAIMSGGELTVTVAGTGSGGPNQEYALGLAIALNGATGIAALAGDTDGTDGGSGSASDPAGAIVTPSTLARAAVLKVDPGAYLANNDSTAFFAQVDGLIQCGPTQTNVNDFRVILIDPV